MQNALYGEGGYYRSNRKRVGKTRNEDFATSSSFAIYPTLIQTALGTLRELNGIDEPTTLVELGCEPGSELFGGELNEGFSQQKSLHWGDPLDFGGTCAIFSNELLDAFAVDRLRYEEGAWKLLGLDITEGVLDIELGEAPEIYRPYLPAQAPEGTIIELSARLITYLRELCAKPWNGIFVAADYGFNWIEALERHQGTLRAYTHQRLMPLKEALTRGFEAGDFDLTAHVNWDVVSAVLRESGLQVKPVMSQEAFLVGYAGRVFPKLSAQACGQLKELVHPAMMGQKFQMLVATR